VDPEPLLFHAEVVWRNEEIAGYVRVGGYGHTLGASVGLAVVEADEPIKKAWVEAGKWQIEIAGVRHAAIASVSPMYDPKLLRVKS
jgi:4-methylaminobutanoate oxidase (formaldehyde-forming)